MSAFLAAVRLLTVLPVGSGPAHADSRATANSPAYFPLVGTLIGLASAGVFVAAAEALPVAVAAALAVATPVALTGALHVDGLGDTFDGLFGGRTGERRLEIMADPRAGAFGVSAIALGFMIRWAVISSLDPETGWSLLVVAAALSRCVVSVVVSSFRYVRVDGIGSAYSAGPWRILPIAIATALAVTVVFGSLPALIAGASALVVGIGVALYARRMIGGVTGDIYGAVVELSEIAALLTLVALVEANIEIGVIW